ncbi:MAG: 60S ribosomal export protein NMD3 [Methanosarcina flavescens]|jgi:nonsense-mediated mRNA decay protein 3|uniref:NMD protein affecting ribosome stability and mRNA decay n=1 Tax=Methanosarcina flavescens TaxID=1715806 RepID=A0A660HQ71_9EURY|nr:60S ribosomal export protein NMD3 [Methanosarcina flavescens]AYK14425.1 NMD protein affecting ribosome stability and mRNA decay [Methanosarcina flavescens]NLK32598.1 NMD protein affecting ribosome stability and mRNA decay [Methanosarcina flavescens]
MNFITCPRCGRECYRLFDSVCRNCFFETFKLIELPHVLHARICSVCGAHLHRSRWENIGSIEDVVLKAVENALFIHNEAGDVEIYLEPREITPYIYRVRAEVDAVVREEPVHAEAETEVRIQRSACDMCSRESGGYFEAIIQIRAAGRFPTEGEKSRCMAIAREAMESMKRKGDRLAFISEVLEQKEGLDLYMGSMNASRQVCRLITSELGGSFSESPTLVGMKDGKNLYRITFSMRLPEFRPGDVIRFRGKIIQIRSSGKKVNGISLEDGSRFISTPEELRGAEKIGNMKDAILTVLVSIEDNAILVLDPETYETVAIKKPMSFNAEAGSEIPVLKTSYGIFALTHSEIPQAK